MVDCGKSRRYSAIFSSMSCLKFFVISSGEMPRRTSAFIKFPNPCLVAMSMRCLRSISRARTSMSGGVGFIGRFANVSWSSVHMA